MRLFNFLVTRSDNVSNIFAILTICSTIVLAFMFFWTIVYTLGSDADKAFAFIVYFASLSNILIALPFIFGLKLPSRLLYFIYFFLVLINLAAYIMFIIVGVNEEDNHSSLSTTLQVLGSIGIVFYGFYALILFLNFDSF